MKAKLFIIYIPLWEKTLELSIGYIRRDITPGVQNTSSPQLSPSFSLNLPPPLYLSLPLFLSQPSLFYSSSTAHSAEESF